MEEAECGPTDYQSKTQAKFIHLLALLSENQGKDQNPKGSNEGVWWR
jgi:hypothetical protein